MAKILSRRDKTINFLYDASKHLPSTALYSSIRSHMLTKSHELNVTTNFFGMAEEKELELDLVPRCDACGVLFVDVLSSNVVETIKRAKWCKKKLRKPKQHSKYQLLKYKKSLKYTEKQLMVTTCNLCKHQMKTKIDKTGPIAVPIHEPPEEEEEYIQSQKKRKRDAFVGLKKSAVLSAQHRQHSNDKTFLSPMNRPQNKKAPGYEIICVDTPSPKRAKHEITNSEQGNRNNLNKKPVNQVNPEVKPKIKTNNNVILVQEQTPAEKKKKKLNSLSNFLKNDPNNQKTENKANWLQSFLNTFT